MNITYITSSDQKLKTAQDIMRPFGITIDRKKIETPEIQSLQVEDVAAFSAYFAASTLDKPVIVTDAGFYIEALNGFPGPLVKHINETLSSAELLNLMKEHENRTVTIKECLAYCAPGEEPRTFTSQQSATLAYEASGNRSSIDNVLILPGFDVTVGAAPQYALEQYWVQQLTHYSDFVNFLTSCK
jgi:XTP/dITP diphosphohydrolase